MKINIFVLLFTCTYVIAAPKNSVKTNERNVLHSKQEKIVTYNTPSELIKAYNFWIGCECRDADKNISVKDEVSSCVKKLFSIQDYADETTIASIPNEIDFVFFNNEAIVSEQVILEWYKKIRPGGML